jgi:hypothetical protein
MNPHNIVLEPTTEVFSSNAGLLLMERLWGGLSLEKRIRKLLPRKHRDRWPRQINKIKSLLFSFALGNDCLSDLDQVRKDAVCRELTSGGVAARTMGDFLRNFGNRHVDRLQDFLVEMALQLRMSLSQEKKFILTMDSTPHEHYSRKMQGLDFNHNNYWCIDSQNAFDQFGFSYLFDLRPGNTFSGRDAELWIHRIFSKIPDSLERWFRADSAYGSFKIFEALQVKKVNFAIVLRENLGRYVRKKNKNLLTWKKTNIHFFDSNECEVAMGLYPINRLGNLRVVFIRAPKRDAQLNLLEDFSEQAYHYYSIVTNISSFDMSEEEVIEFYRGRANVENFIREHKYNYDFLNFPCKLLKANQVFGLVGAFAHNMIRFLSFCMPQKRKRVRGKDGKIRTVIQQGYFAKKVRNELIKIPCQVVRSARKIKLKVSFKTKEVLEKISIEVCRILSRDYHCKKT